jgi:tetratricopeptide (TPR) repeat protein
MAKLALLIGVSDYESGLNPLPGAVRDIAAMQQVLQHPEMGGFDRVNILPNPEPTKMQEAIESLFSDCAKEDLALLFFSGHGIKDDSGRLYFATRATRKNPKGELVKATAVPAGFVQDIMGNSRCKRQIVILDCCFSGAFSEGMMAKDDDSVDVQTQLGGEGRAVLTSSTSTQYSFEQQDSDLSVYTRYFVEGIETGAADLDGNGSISIDELHEYTRKKVQEAAPAMRPKIYAVEEGFKIRLAQAPTNDPQLSYRREVERFASQGELSTIGRFTLDAYRQELMLSPEVANTIEAEVLKPYQEHQRKLQQYKQVWQQASEREQPLSASTRGELKRLQKVLGLRDEDIALLTAQMPQPANQAAQSVVPASVVSSVERTEEASPAKAEATSSIKTSAANQPAKLLSAAPDASRKNIKLFALAGGALVAVLVGLGSLVAHPTSQPESSPAPSASPSASAATSSQLSSKDLFTQAKDKGDKGDNQGAIADYTQAIQIKPDYAEAYSNRGDARSELKDHQGAIEDYSQAIKLKPDYADAYNSRGVDRFDLGDKRGAIEDYSQAIKLKPDYAEAYSNRGNARSELKDHQGAIEDYSQAIKLKPDYADAYYNRGSARSDLGDKRGAIADSQQAAKLYQQQGKTKAYQDAQNQIKNLQ